MKTIDLGLKLYQAMVKIHQVVVEIHRLKFIDWNSPIEIHRLKFTDCNSSIEILNSWKASPQLKTCSLQLPPSEWNYSERKLDYC